MLVSHPTLAFSALLYFQPELILLLPTLSGAALAGYTHCTAVQLRQDFFKCPSLQVSQWNPLKKQNPVARGNDISVAAVQQLVTQRDRCIASHR